MAMIGAPIFKDVFKYKAKFIGKFTGKQLALDAIGIVLIILLVFLFGFPDKKRSSLFPSVPGISPEKQAGNDTIPPESIQNQPGMRLRIQHGMQMKIQFRGIEHQRLNDQADNQRYPAVPPNQHFVSLIKNQDLTGKCVDDLSGRH